MHSVEAGSRLAGRFVLVDALGLPAAHDEPMSAAEATRDTTLSSLGTPSTPSPPSTPRPPEAATADARPAEAFAADPAGSSRWRGHDELLSRTVAIRLVGTGSRADRLLEAARSAARLTDPQIARVLDVGTSDGIGYVVTEWCEGSDLATELLRTGPLPAATALRVAAATAHTLATVEASGLDLPELSPADIRLLDDASIRITGIELPAPPAQRSGGSRDAPSAGAQLSGAVLYAALTGRWPLVHSSSLPDAPSADGAVLRPRRVRGGVPAELDAIAAAALGLGPRPGSSGHVGGLATAADVAQALDALGPADGAMPAHDDAQGDERPDDVVRLLVPGRGASRFANAVRAGAVGLLLVGGGLVAWQASHLVRSVATRHPDEPGTAARPTPAAPTPVSLARLVPGVVAFDPPPTGDGDEHPGEVRFVLDADPTTSWSTYHYKTAAFGGLKPGIGLLLDLHGPHDVAAVTVDIGGGGTDVELHLFDNRPDEPLRSGAVDARPSASGAVTLLPPSPRSARWAVIWFTRLPGADGDYQATVSHVGVMVRSAASGVG